MTTDEFLQSVWPSKGIYCLATYPHKSKKTGAKIFYHHAFQSIDAAAAFAVKNCETLNVYFAVQTLARYTQKTTASGRIIKTVERTAANAAFARAFYLDLDVGDGKAYASQDEAWTALKKFAKSIGLPEPLAVRSGRGLHIYWPMTEDVPSTTWLVQAQRLKALAAHHGLLADPAVTADTARVLRPIGTFNRKDPSHPIRVALAGRRAPPAAFSDLVDVLDRAVAEMPPSAAPSPVVAARQNETLENIAVVRSMLSVISPDIDRDTWRQVVWAVMATRWSCAKLLARDWSAQGTKFDEAGFDSVVQSFDPQRGTGFGTLVHMSRQHGYVGEIPSTGDLTVDASPIAQSASTGGAKLEDFLAYMPFHQYIHVPTGEFWPSASVDGQLPLVTVGTKPDGSPRYVRPSKWLDENRPVWQMTWLPGAPSVIRDRVARDGELIDHEGATCYNLYRPPMPSQGGDPAKAGPWIDLVRKLYPNEADHLIAWQAHRVQHPGEKINHALVLGGTQGIGKDTLLAPLRTAVGSWNFQEIGPQQLTERFNPYIKSVVLRISEAHDLGELTRNQLYERMKTLTTAPPDTLRVDEKHRNEYYVRNCCGVILTTNHKAGGVYLTPSDRRHFVAWSMSEKDDFTETYWTELWAWYEQEGYSHITALLKAYDLSAFNPKAPPPKTAAFWEIVDAGRAPEDAELAGVIDTLGNPEALTKRDLERATEGDMDFGPWIRDRKNRRVIPYRLEQCGYAAVRNNTSTDGYWTIGGKRVPVYAKAELVERDRIRAASALASMSANR